MDEEVYDLLSSPPPASPGLPHCPLGVRARGSSNSSCLGCFLLARFLDRLLLPDGVPEDATPARARRPPLLGGTTSPRGSRSRSAPVISTR
jgi:hypothetical protein